MFHKVHFRLTVLCTGITAVIMIIMSISYLYVSETGLKHRYFLSFKSDINSIITNLEQQAVISHEWLSKTEAQKNYLISILDAGTPFLFNELKNGTADTLGKELLLDDALAYFNEEFGESALAMTATQSPYSTYHVEYEFTAPSTAKNYYGCVAIMGQPPVALQIIIVAPMDAISVQITEQRIRFLIINLMSILSLAVFSWFFTWKLLKPINESRKQQMRFVAAASHELRTPLAVITSCLTALSVVLRKNSAADAGETSLRSFLHTIDKESKRMSGLVEDMLVLSQADNQTWNMRMDKIQSDTLLLNAYETFEAMALEKGLHLTVELPEQSLVYITGDQDRLTQVLAILIHNAISYTPKGGAVNLRLYIHKKQVCFLITDTGPGIPDEEKEKIFDRFYRVDKARHTKEHSGLGLSIAYEITEAHKGRIIVKDNPGGGAAFEVIFPIC